MEIRLIGDRFGPGEILGYLAAGGMGEEYKAHDARLGRNVAMRVLPAHRSANPEVCARFSCEGTVTGHCRAA